MTYQLLSGRLPYEATSLTELALKQQREAPPPLDAVNPEVPHARRAPSPAGSRSTRAGATSGVATPTTMRAALAGGIPPGTT